MNSELSLFIAELFFFFFLFQDNDFSRGNLYQQDLPNYLQTWYVVFLITLFSFRESREDPRSHQASQLSHQSAAQPAGAPTCSLPPGPGPWRSPSVFHQHRCGGSLAGTGSGLSRKAWREVPFHPEAGVRHAGAGPAAPAVRRCAFLRPFVLQVPSSRESPSSRWFCGTQINW